MDETEVPLDAKSPKAVAAKGQRKARYRTSENKNKIIILCFGNTTRQAQPPFIIYDSKKLYPLWTHGAVPGTRYGLSKSGWTDQELFQGWCKEHSVTHTVQGHPLLLLVDGLSSHYDPETIRFTKKHSIIIFCLPPHTTYKVQTLDVSFFSPLK